MNRGEALGLGLAAAVFVFVFQLALWYYLIIDNLIIIGLVFGYELEAVKDNIWWIFIGFALLAGIRAGTKAQKYARRDYCKHCSREI